MHFEDPAGTLQELTTRIVAIRDSLDLPSKTSRKKELERLMAEPGFWDNRERAREIVAELKRLKGVIEPIEALLARADDADALLELANEEKDQASFAELDTDLLSIREQMARVELMTLLSGKNDARDCFFSIQAGAGGTEACDWAEMLLRMYLRYFERNDYQAEELDRTDGEEAGIRSITLKIQGFYAMGYLSCERGVHRLVRISPFDASKRRHTSFAAVDVLPVLDELDVELKDEELDIVFFRRAAGAGGQNVNKVATAVRIKHLPTSLAVECVNERSQAQNKRMALAILQSKIEQLKQEQRDRELQSLYGDKGEIAWGSQIRSYVLDDRRVKDHRTLVETPNPERVLDGELQPFIEAELRRRAGDKKK
ncbi:MAG: peptide chain release factor 2 [Planctomycetota bacterium]|nr:MAG: peptide chain release factor 2 [Planctomycetota bacterium]